MSQPIKLTPENIEAYTNEFAECLKTAQERATIYFTEKAWLKMQMLISGFNKEVAWHGVVERGADPSVNEYFITDILVYPQTVTATTVEMDTSAYDEWIRNNIEDERFFHIGMQGHSHVDMRVAPSTVDIKHQEDILAQLTDDMFYIFMIWNRHGARYTRIYDLLKNVLFETEDVDIKVVEAMYGLNAFMNEARNIVTERNRDTKHGRRDTKAINSRKRNNKTNREYEEFLSGDDYTESIFDFRDIYSSD